MKLIQFFKSKGSDLLKKIGGLRKIEIVFETIFIKMLFSFVELKLLPRFIKKKGDELKSNFYKFRSLFFRKIFGIGLSRTGTKSLSLALKELGFRSIHYPSTEFLYQLVDKFDALTDTPIALNFKILDNKYPNSKFILTIRDMESWLKSCKNHLRVTEPSEPWQFELREKIYGTTVWNEKKYRETYDKHLNNVKKYFKNRQSDLLILNIVNGEGYEKLCPFLGKKVLKRVFPHKNIGKITKNK